MLDVSKGGHHVTTLRTTRGFYPSQDPTLGQVGRFFNGNADSDVGLRAGLTKDIWTVVNPNLQPLQPLINQADKLFATRAPEGDVAGPRSSREPRGCRPSTSCGRCATRPSG